MARSGVRDTPTPCRGGPQSSMHGETEQTPSSWQTLNPPDTRTCTVEELRRYFEDSWRLYVQLFDTLEPGALHLQPDPLRHPLVFYRGHTAAFYINKLRAAGLLDAGIDPRLDELLAVGVDPDRPEELSGEWGWPSEAAVRAYCQQVYATVSRFLDRWRPQTPIRPADPGWAFLMGVEHERIHLETSSVLFRQLPLDQLRRPTDWAMAPTAGEPPPLRWLPVPAAAVRLGRDEDRPSRYGWDNEFGTLQVPVSAFEASETLVSNRAFHAFWADGGYQDRRHWTDEGWQWLTGEGAAAPRFWRVRGETLRYRAMFEELDMPWSWPVEVNCHEAEAYCRWRGDGSRLLTEAEWQVIADDAPRQGDDVFTHPGYNLNLRCGSPTPVDAHPGGRGGLGFYDAHGNVWQWLSDDFQPLPGFAAHPLYADFSAPYFTPHHAALRGGAWVTTGTGASRHYRLWFRRHFYQHAGFRIARDRSA